MKKTLFIRTAAMLCALILAVCGQASVFAEGSDAANPSDTETIALSAAPEADEPSKADEPSGDEASSKAGKTGRILFLLYHDIAEGDTLKETDDPNWCTTAAKLEADIDALWAMGYRSLSCADYYRGNYEKDQDYFVLTFDDGYLSNYELLPGILEKTGTYADIFMCTECTTLPNHFKYSQAQKMKEGGLIRLYSHYNEHVYINELSQDELLRGIKSTFAYLEKRLGESDWFFAYPHSSFSEETFSLLHDCGVKLQFVQILPPASYSFDWQNGGVVLRYTVAYDSDMAAAAEEYFALLAGESGTSADASASESTEAEPNAEGVAPGEAPGEASGEEAPEASVEGTTEE